MTERDPILKIVEAMQKADKPLILNHIAKRANESAQLVNYHLCQMIKKGLVLCLNEDDKKYYILQPIFYDENWLIALYKMLTPFVEGMGDKIGYEQYSLDISQERVVINILVMFLRRFEDELEKGDFLNTSNNV
ncbi:hypothetical protein ES703_16308 [subsurface metagenome]